MKYVLPIICLVLCFLSCKKEEVESLAIRVEDHYANAVIDSAQIINIIKGDWKLIDYGCQGFCSGTATALPDATLSFKGNEGQLYFKEADSLAVNLDFEWTINRLSHPSEFSAYELITTPKHHATYLLTFSENHMSYIGFHGIKTVYERQ